MIDTTETLKAEIAAAREEIALYERLIAKTTYFWLDKQGQKLIVASCDSDGKRIWRLVCNGEEDGPFDTPIAALRAVVAREGGG